MVPIPPNPRRALAVMAHPDDIEFMAGGLMSRWAREGVELHYCLLTDGSSGSRDRSARREDLIALRREEQRAAGALLGVTGYTFLSHMDGRLVPSIELRLEIARVIRQFQPDAVVTSDPRFTYSDWYINHPDHRAAGEATLAAIMPLANTRLAAPELLAEGLEPHDVRDIYLAGPAQPTLWMAVSEEDFGRKLAAMQAHASQIAGWDVAGMLRSFAEQGAQEARAHGVECELAETYVYIRLGRDQEAVS